MRYCRLGVRVPKPQGFAWPNDTIHKASRNADGTYVTACRSTKTLEKEQVVLSKKDVTCRTCLRLQNAGW